MGRGAMQQSARKVPVNITIDIRLLESLDALVAEAGTTRSEFVRRLIEDCLDDAALSREAERRLAAIEAGEPTVTLADVRRELGA